MMQNTNKLSIYIPLNKRSKKLLERIAKLAKQQDRSVNHLVVQAMLEYVKREEHKEGV